MNDLRCWADRVALAALRRAAGPVSVRFALPHWAEEQPHASITIQIANRRGIAGLLLKGDLAFGDAYADGTIEVQGPLVEALAELHRSRANQPGTYARLFARWLDWSQGNSRRGSRRNIHLHYDLSPEFYSLWLDALMLYTCAYFPNMEASLEEAQIAKMDLVCRKVWLRPGESVVEAGCGWGSLALYMARQYGVRVRAFNVSREQIRFAQRMAREQGLEHQVEFIEDDYRNISGRYDAFVSVGMLEHVGKSHYSELAAVIRRSIGESGRGLLHFIGRNRHRPLSSWIRKRIFPGAYPPTLAEALAPLEPHDFSILDVENLRPHYARTLEQWLERFDHCFDRVKEQFGMQFARAWRLYLAGSVVAFRVGALQLFQVVFVAPGCQGIPSTREPLYQTRALRQQDESWTPVTS